MPERKTYAGGCHCGSVRYEAESDLGQVIDCNCSICQKRGALWAFVSKPNFRLLKGENALTDYQFGRKRLHHLFCGSCGIGSFSRGLARNGEETFAINVICLDGVDIAALKPTPFNGKDMVD